MLFGVAKLQKLSRCNRFVKASDLGIVGRRPGMPFVALPWALQQDSEGLGWCRREELNLRPHPYQGCALPLSYCGTVLGTRPELATGPK